MPGGLLNLITTGSENVILNSNPKKTFFKATYAKHTNFGLQKFRINYNKEKELSFNNETELTFKIDRYGDLINDSFICVTMPNIYSPFHIINEGTNQYKFIPYEFQWVKNLGTTMIKEIEIYAGGLTLAKYSGEYLHCLSYRDLDGGKKNVFDNMVGNVPEMNNPAFVSGNPLKEYPNASCDPTITNPNPEPSIRQRKIYIPLLSWFSESSKMSLPLVSLQYQEVFIKITFRPVRELYTIKEIEFDKRTKYGFKNEVDANGVEVTGTVAEATNFTNWYNSRKRIAPEINNDYHSIKNFLRKPTLDEIETTDQNSEKVLPKLPSLINEPSSWFSDIHIMSTYVFLDTVERKKFAQKPISYLVKQVIEHEYLSETGSKKIDVFSAHCVTDYMFRFRRNDVKDRNEWTNFTNWEYEDVKPLPLVQSPFINRFEGSKNIYITNNIGEYPKNLKNILENMGIVLNGEYRENLLDSGVFLYCEKYSRTLGIFKDGLYHYSFALDTNKFQYQPTGSMNMSKYNKISFEYNTIAVPISDTSSVQLICGDDGGLIGVSQNTSDLNKYNFDFKIFEERYNVINIQNGNINLMFSN